MQNRSGNRSIALRWLRLVCFSIAAWTGPAVADNYLILSLVGDRLTVVGAERQVGSNLDRNRQQIVELKDQSLDDFAVRVAGAVIQKERPSASIAMLRATDPTVYSLRDTWLDTDSINAQALLAVVTKLSPPSSDTHLLLIAPNRHELDLRAQERHMFTGSKAAGLGFYIDQATQMTSNEATKMETGRGFLGVFANFQLVLIDVQSSAIEAHESVAVGTVRAASRAEDKNPWNALSADQKIQVLQGLMKQEIQRVVPGLLSSAKAQH